MEPFIAYWAGITVAFLAGVLFHRTFGRRSATLTVASAFGQTDAQLVASLLARMIKQIDEGGGPVTFGTSDGKKYRIEADNG